MKYLKRFEKFDLKDKPVDVATDMNTFNSSEENIKDFNSKKSALLNIYLTYQQDATPTDATPTDLYRKLLSGKFIKPGNVNSKIIFTNPLFAVYSEYCAKSRELKNISGTLDQKKQELEAKQGDTSGDAETRNNDIQTLNNDIQDKMKSLDQLKRDISSLQKSASDQIKSSTTNLDGAKKRITQLNQTS